MKELDTTSGYKPLDFGKGGVTGSVDFNGRLIASSEHGNVTMTTATTIPEQRRRQPEFVCAYRTLLAWLNGFGPIVSIYRKRNE